MLCERIQFEEPVGLEFNGFDGQVIRLVAQWRDKAPTAMCAAVYVDDELTAIDDPFDEALSVELADFVSWRQELTP